MRKPFFLLFLLMMFFSTSLNASSLFGIQSELTSGSLQVIFNVTDRVEVSAGSIIGKNNYINRLDFGYYTGRTYS